MPVSIMAALVAQELLVRDGKLVPLSSNLELMAAVPAFLVAITTRSLLGTVAAGIVSLMLLRLAL
ncbi:branched-subunit amino acid transport protein [Paenibacillus forsythiae]|uniref:Branched-subunit amino acid transport protein n=1 Tax=Paenibacillus forsythiae TaxID=365616 RepID=A0ABU3H1V5_9BACL|nr:AzlD domain-containing protein [Paenibacillus forsythiae]MDT3424810.1 branched-subunit amino acid transport protein [Paenibacillus forsythiae]